MQEHTESDGKCQLISILLQQFAGQSQYFSQLFWLNFEVEKQLEQVQAGANELQSQVDDENKHVKVLERQRSLQSKTEQKLQRQICGYKRMFSDFDLEVQVRFSSVLAAFDSMWSKILKRFCSVVSALCRNLPA